MPEGHFHWHSKSRAFAGDQEVALHAADAPLTIPCDPVSDALQMLYSAVTGTRAFCVSNRALPELDQLTAGQLATLTGGTSGAPKVIVRTHASWIKSFEANAAMFTYIASDSIAVLGALSHSLALYGVLEAAHHGLEIHALSPLKPSGQSARMQEHGCTILYATPTQLRLLPKSTHLPEVRLILCGGGVLSDETRRHILALCPNAKLHVFYGAAETSFITLGGPDTPAGSVGRPYPGVELAVHAPDTAGTGQIWVRSPYLFDGYLHGDSQHTQRDGDWLTVGEHGYLDAEGHVFLRGRAGRIINIADQTVFPEELEAQFNALRGISQCAVLARHDALRGHHLVAVLEGSDDAILAQKLRDYCASNALVAPRDVIFLDPFPLLASGKPDLQRIASLTESTP
ncbi:AMP-binding protein [Sulfitobacter sp.]|uniref:AMP-binding protein n=1 Tax=Sulfitobacter sp. TaxID=1903071 RepID=UPI003001EB13